MARFVRYLGDRLPQDVVRGWPKNALSVLLTVRFSTSGTPDVCVTISRAGRPKTLGRSNV
jgi:hypothetical protein